MQKQDRGRLRWRRALPLFLPAGLGILLMAAFLFIGWMPLNLAITGQDLKLSSNGRGGVATKGFSAYVNGQEMKFGGPTVPVVYARIPEAKLNGVCISLTLTFPIIDTWTVQLHSTKEIVIKDLTAAAANVHLEDAKLYSETNDGELPKKDLSNVVGGVQLNKNASELDGTDLGPVGIMGVESNGQVQFSELIANAKGATLSGSAALVPGLGIPKIGHGRGTEHYECY